MSTEVLIRSQGDVFVVGDRSIPKNNYRNITLVKAEISEERQLELSVSSDKPYQRYWYYEELEHSKAAVDLARFNDSANLLFNHNRDDYLGVIEKAWIDDGKLINVVRFDTHELAERILKSVKDGIIRNVSIGYVIDELVLVKKSESDKNTYRATKWTPLETSLVTVPADASVGIGRSFYDLKPSLEQSTNKGESSGQLENTNTDAMPTELEVNENNRELDNSELLKTERERIQSIMAAGQRYGCTELVKRAINEGMSIEQARVLMADKILNNSQSESPIAEVLKPVPMSKKERSAYRFNRAIAYAAGLIPASKAGLEIEVSKDIEHRTGKSPKGLYVDQTLLVRAPYDTQTPAAAGDLIATDLLPDRFVEALHNESAFLKMGVTYLRDLIGNIEIPRESSYTGAYWVGESQVIPEDQGSFDKIGLSPHKLAVLTEMTEEMVTQSSIDLEQLTRARLLRGLALELDRAIGFGSGIGEEPLGIAFHPEVKSIVLGENGGVLGYDRLIDMTTEISAANALMGGEFGFVVNSRTKGKLMKTLEHNTGSSQWIWRPNGHEGIIAGYRACCSNQIPNNLVKGTASNLTAAFFGNFRNVLVALWSGMDVMVNPFSKFNQAILILRAMQLVDINYTRGDYFCVATDVQNN